MSMGGMEILIRRMNDWQNDKENVKGIDEGTGSKII